MWEMINLASEVFPEEEIKDSIKRVKNSLHPSLRMAFGEIRHNSPEDLLDRCRIVIKNIRELDKINGTHTKLPPLTFHDKENSKFNNSNENKANSYQRRGGWNYRYNNNFRGRGYYRNNYRNGNYQARQNYNDSAQSYQFQNNQYIPRPQHQSNNNQRQSGQQQFNNQINNRGSHNSFNQRNPNQANGGQVGRQNQRNLNVECYRCHGWGHIARECTEGEYVRPSANLMGHPNEGNQRAPRNQYYHRRGALNPPAEIIQDVRVNDYDPRRGQSQPLNQEEFRRQLNDVGRQ